MTTTHERYGDAWVCTDCYFAHHYGVTEVKREATDDEAHDWAGGYLRTGHAVPNVTTAETDEGLEITEWFAGESDTPCHREPLKFLEGFEVFDHTCSDHYYGQDPVEDEDTGEYTEPCDQCGGTDDEDGIQDFSWSACDGCHSHLGGSRYRLSLWKETDERSEDHHEQRPA